MARPQRTLDVTKPLHAFAAELRKLRSSAGDPKYLTMARRVGDVSRTALAEAAGGDHLPTWHTVQKFVTACGGDPNDWRQRWESLRDQASERSQPESAPTVLPIDDNHPQPRWQDRRRVSLVLGVVVSAVVATVVTMLFLNNEARPTESSPRAAAAVPSGPVVIVQNMIAVGGDSLIEDPTPAYLSTRAEPRCRLNGCMIPDTLLSSGVTVVATCHRTGTRVANYNLDSTEVQRNPHRVRSALWYRLVLADGRAGFIAEVYLTPASRGGLGLPVCATDVPVTGV
ncbi:hypothetical protein ACWER9_12760 [Micromonospora sp. NPDC003944]